MAVEYKTEELNDTGNGISYKTLKEMVNGGDPRLQYLIGRCYYNGINIEKNYNEAFKWHKLSAEQGYAKSQSIIGNMYRLGEGIKENNEEAVKWYEMAAKHNFAIAQNNLGVSYREGCGITQDFTKSLELLELSAKQDYWLAYLNLGDAYYEGLGIEKNLFKAREYYEKALSLADVESDEWESPNENQKRQIQNTLNKINNEIKEIEEKAEVARKAARTEVFISYSHKDGVYREGLEPHLKMLSKNTEIKWWDDTNIKSGEEWHEKIQEALSKAKIVVVFASKHFFSSDYIEREEWSKILEKADKEGATILWALVSPCDYESTGIAKYQAVGNPKTPLAKLEEFEQDDIYTDLVKRIRNIYESNIEEE